MLGALAAVGIAYILTWFLLERRRRRSGVLRPPPADLLTGFVTNFFDTLGIGCFAPTTAIFKIFKRVPDETSPARSTPGTRCRR